MKREDIHTGARLWLSTIRNWVDHGGGQLAVAVTSEPYWQHGDTMRPATVNDPSSGVLVDIHYSDERVTREVVSLFQLKGTWAVCSAMHERRQLEIAAQRARLNDRQAFDAITIKRAHNAGMTSVAKHTLGQLTISTDQLNDMIEHFEQRRSVKT